MYKPVMKQIQFILFAFFALTVISCGGNRSSDGLSGEITIDGSSTVYPITEAVAEEFRNVGPDVRVTVGRSEEHTSELQSPMRISYAVFCLKRKSDHILVPTQRAHSSNPVPRAQRLM